MASSTEEQYLKTILEIGHRHGDPLVRMGQLAQTMNLTAGTITSMLNKLAGQGLIEYVPRQGCKLTGEGRDVALRLLRKHRLLETFLARTLSYDWAEVHAEAEQLEHAVSERFIEAIDRLLGHPSLDPHGSPIPGTDLELPPEEVQQLSLCRTGQMVTIARIADEEVSFLTWLKEAGIIPGRRFKIREVSPQAAVLIIESADTAQAISIGMTMADRLFVKV